MKKVNWDVQYISPPPAIKYCKKCGVKKEYVCSNLFRVNAQRKSLDIWLIYKCSDCDSTWNMTIFSRINPKSISPELLEGFHSNSGELVTKYAMNADLIHKNGAQSGLPKYIIQGPVIDFTIPVELHIKSPYPFRLKLSTLLREKLSLSQSDFEQRVRNGSIRSSIGLDLKKCKINSEAKLIIEDHYLALENKSLISKQLCSCSM